MPGCEGPASAADVLDQVNRLYTRIGRDEIPVSDRIVSAVWEAVEQPYRGIVVHGFVVEPECGHWHHVPAEPPGRTPPLAPGDPESITRYATRLGVVPGPLDEACTSKVTP